ncbi:hypothetical protein FOG51_04039 [Hanseniaspora uvarum]|nr:hypothetical protein FOG51_04039 [Hanseniaspora uvarum]KAF0276005.1 hypothetical protein FOG50_03142 [Hanseniaspora uvarum]
MGLAGERKKQRIGWDPRNLNWLATGSNPTETEKDASQKTFQESSFGLKLLMKHGYDKKTKSKTSEEIMESIINSKEFGHNIKIKVKDDKFGIGYTIGSSQINKKINPRTGKVEAVEGNDNFGLDMFQQILFNMNNKESSKDKKKRKKIEAQNAQLDAVRTERIKGKYGMDFVKGEVLKSELAAILKKEKEIKEKKENKEKKEKKDKKEKKSKKRKRDDDSDDIENSKKKSKKDKKDKKSKKDKKHKVKVIDHDMKIEDVKPVDFKGTRYAARSKFIRSKRSAISDPSALKEIFMMS